MLSLTLSPYGAGWCGYASAVYEDKLNELASQQCLPDVHLHGKFQQNDFKCLPDSLTQQHIAECVDNPTSCLESALKAHDWTGTVTQEFLDKVKKFYNEIKDDPKYDHLDNVMEQISDFMNNLEKDLEFTTKEISYMLYFKEYAFEAALTHTAREIFDKLQQNLCSPDAKKLLTNEKDVKDIFYNDGSDNCKNDLWFTATIQNGHSISAMMDNIGALKGYRNDLITIGAAIVETQGLLDK